MAEPMNEQVYRWLYQRATLSSSGEVRTSVTELSRELGLERRKVGNILTVLKIGGFITIQPAGTDKKILLTNNVHPSISKECPSPPVDWKALCPGRNSGSYRKEVFEFIVRNMVGGCLSITRPEMAERMHFSLNRIQDATTFLKSKKLINIRSAIDGHSRRITITLPQSETDEAILKAERKKKMIAEGVAKRRRAFLENEQRLFPTWRFLRRSEAL